MGTCSHLPDANPAFFYRLEAKLKAYSQILKQKLNPHSTLRVVGLMFWPPCFLSASWSSPSVLLRSWRKLKSPSDLRQFHRLLVA